ncbi:MAG: hypothetical protein KDA86_05505 [Planctomycetaceae bacterium]|nr:hypothetical protein [Planctomycetaceae bacterium]
MWCASCQTDVAGEVSADGQSVLCTACGSEVSSGRSLSLHPKTREARELLERWSTEELLDPDVRLSHPPRAAVSGGSGETTEASARSRANSKNVEEVSVPVKQPESTTPRAVEQVDAEEAHSPNETSGKENQRRKFRVDDQHQTRVGSHAPVPAPHPKRQARQPSRTTRIDAAHEQSPAPHFNIASAFEGKSRPGQGESLWGQILAYSGVGLLTVGTVMVLWGYFGGPESYTPTGWLLASAGQMLLFLGVVTLVSGGMEQTTHEVSRRIEYLGDQLVRFEQAQQDLLRGPHFAVNVDEESETGSRSRRMAATEDSDRNGR